MGRCKNCHIETEDRDYTFCSQECQLVYTMLGEKSMTDYGIDKELYENWLKERHTKISEMETREQIEARILELSKMEFFVKREWSMLHQQYDKITGRKGIAPWLKAERDKLITDPNIKVNWDGEPRPKKGKFDKLKMMGIDMPELIEQQKKQKAEAKAKRKLTAQDILNDIMSGPTKESEPVEEPKPTMTDEQVKSKTLSLKERMRKAAESNG